MNVITRTLPAARTEAAKPARATARRLLGLGALAGPVFLVGSFAQLPLNPGFDLTRHAFSFLSNGPHGWIQQTVFVITGVLNIGGGVGLLRLLTGRIRAVAAGAAVMLGTGQIISGVWPPAPSFGYPSGAPAGYPAEMSTASALHAIGFTASMISWVVLLIALAIWLRRRAPRFAVTLTLTAVAVLLVPALSGFPFGTVFLYVVVSCAFLVTTAALTRILRATR